MAKYRTKNRPDMLTVLALVAGIGILTSTVVEAEEGLFGEVDLFSSPKLSEYLDGDVRVAGNNRGALHLSVLPNGQEVELTSHANQPARPNNNGVHFSFRMSF